MLRYIPAIAACLVGAAFGQTDRATGLERQVRDGLAGIPHVSVFEYLAYRIDGRDVVLLGRVVRAGLKEDADAVVRGIPGLPRVTTRLKCYRSPRVTIFCGCHSTGPSIITTL